MKIIFLHHSQFIYDLNAMIGHSVRIKSKKKRRKRTMKNVKTNNKGFSLVELIIVIAIMAILIGVLAPQYMKYVEKSRVSADKDILDGVYNAVTTAFADPDLVATAPTPPSSGWSNVSITSSAGYYEEVLDTLKVASMTDVQSSLKSKISKAASNAINVQIDSKGNFRVFVGGSTAAAVKSGTAIVVPENAAD